MRRRKHLPRPRRWPSYRSLRCRSLVALVLLIALVRRAAASPPPSTSSTRSLLTFGLGPAYPNGVGAGPATPAAPASNGNGTSASSNGKPLRACAGPFEICPAPLLCRNPNRGNEWCYWLYVDKASCVCL